MLGTHQIFIEVLADFGMLVVIIAPSVIGIMWLVDKWSKRG
jgi:hypothetical protein